MRLIVPRLLLITMFLSSCDPGRTLELKVTGDKSGSITVYCNRQAIDEYDRDTGKLVIHVPYGGSTKKYDTAFIYGLGSWHDGDIFDLTNHIDSLVVNSSTETLIIKDSSKLSDYLKDHRHGFAGSVLTIKAN